MRPGLLDPRLRGNDLRCERVPFQLTLAPALAIIPLAAQQKGEPASFCNLAISMGLLRLWGKGKPVNDCFRILLQQKVSDFLALISCHLTVASGENRRAPLHIVGITGKEVD